MARRGLESVRNPIALLIFLVFSSSAVPAQEHLNGVIVSDQGWATRAGMEILEQGGNAVDAAVATAFALAVVAPASSSLGGGGFMVLYEAEEKKAHVLDFLELSPAAIRPVTVGKDPRVQREELVSGGLAVAVPGAVAGLLEALKRFGSLPLDVVTAPAIRYAENGFPVTPRLRRTVEENRTDLDQNPHFRRIFIREDGEPYPVGEKIRQPELAETLKRIARQGSDAFYEGAVGQAIASAVQEAGGVLNQHDLKSYKPLWRRPIIGDYRGTVVVTVPPPSSGGIALIEMLNVMEGYALRQFPHNSAAYLHVLAEALKAAHADRLVHGGDPEFGEVPLQRLTSKEYAAALRSEISTAQARAREGIPSIASAHGHQGTNHLGVLDGEGNAVAMGLTLNDPFGAKLLVREAGVILNNSMAQFAVPAKSEEAARAGLNNLAPRKRPASSLTPTILLQGDQPVLVIGASGSAMTSAVLQTILNVLDFGMPLEQAIAAVRLDVAGDGTPTLVVESGLGEKVLAGLAAKGHTVNEKDASTAVHAIHIHGPAITGQSDPRLAKE